MKSINKSLDFNKSTMVELNDQKLKDINSGGPTLMTTRLTTIFTIPIITY